MNQFRMHDKYSRLELEYMLEKYIDLRSKIAMKITYVKSIGLLWLNGLCNIITWNTKWCVNSNAAAGKNLTSYDLGCQR